MVMREAIALLVEMIYGFKLVVMEIGLNFDINMWQWKVK